MISNDELMELKQHFYYLYKMALIDNNLDINEKKLLYDIAHEKGITQDELDELLSKIIDLDIDYSFSKLSLEKKVEYLYDLTKMVLADNEVKDEEIELLQKFCISFGFDEDKKNDIVNFFIDSIKSGKTKSDILELLK
jgi:uncharacterized tellurite resistance protein B-like protein